MKQNITKKDLKQIAYTMDYLKNNFPAEIYNYTNALFKALYTEDRRVSGLTKSQRQSATRTAEFIKAKKDMAIKKVMKTKSKEDFENAQDIAKCYDNYVNFFVNKALGTETQQQF